MNFTGAGGAGYIEISEIYLSAIRYFATKRNFLVIFDNTIVTDIFLCD